MPTGGARIALRAGPVWPAVVALVAVACTGPAADPPAAPDPPDPADDPAAEPPEDPDANGAPEEPDANGVPEEPPRRAADLPGERTEVTGTVWDGRVVAVGGLDGAGNALADVHLYDPDDDTWTAGPDLPVALHHTAVTTLGERVYVVGGYAIRDGAWVAEAAVRSLGPGEDEWRDEPALATPRGALAVAATGDRLVAVGGVGPDGRVLATTEVLTADADAWAPGPDLRTAREHLDATAVGDEVYAVAGRAGGLDTNHASVEVLREGTWEAAPDLSFPRGGIGAATVDGGACVAGGEEPGATIGPVECLTDAGWQVVAELAVPRHGLVVAAVDGALHVVGGGREPGLTVSGVHEVIPVAVP